MIRMSYTALDTSDVHGELVADYLVGIDADFRIEDGSGMIFEEPSFPVVELARSLELWVSGGANDDFAFESMSSDEALVVIRGQEEGWVVYSEWTPQVISRPVAKSVMEEAVRRFVDDVRTDLDALGLDASWILGRGGQ